MPKALAISCPCRARRHNWLKSWQKSCHADFGCVAARELEARSDQARRLRVPPAAALTARLRLVGRFGPADYIDALVSGLATPEEQEGRLSMILQTGYFDDSGSDAGSQWYVLAGFIASVEDWKAVSTKWAETLNKEPSLRYFEMSEAMAMEGQFRRGWTVPLRNQRILELVDIITELNPPHRVFSEALKLQYVCEGHNWRRRLQ